MDNISSFGYWVRRRRKAMDLTQEVLAQQVGCSVFTIRKIERDERRPSRQIADLLADHLAIPTEERDYFLSMARGEFVASMPSPIEDLPPPAFLQVDQESATDNDSPFVARQLELTQLDSFLEDVLTGKGRVAFAIGEAGTGKTTLVQEFSQRAQATDSQLIVVGGNCQAFTGVGDPYLPFREILGLLTGDVEARWTTGVIGQEQARRLWAVMPYTVQALVDHGPDLLDIFISSPALVQRATLATPAGTDWLAQLKQVVARQEINRGPANRQQVDLFEQYIKVLHALARQRPILLILDDLQWSDAGSINLLFHLGRQLEGTRILVLGIYRPADVAAGRDGERHPLEAVVNEFQRSFGDIHIDLSQTEGQHFVDTLLDSQPNQLASEFRETLFRQTQGQALFTIEMLRGMQARGDLVQDEQGRWVVGPYLDWQTLPTRIEGAIGERIERLPVPLQETLKTASVEGEFFTAEVVARVQGIDEPQVIRQLSGVLDRQHRLVRSQSSQRLSDGGQRLSEYRFRHILFQRYLYNSMDEVEQVYLHEAVGNALEQLYGDQTDAVAAQLARHFQVAGATGKAIGYLQQAGERAARLLAYEEAIEHFTLALELLETLPDTPENTQQALTLLLDLSIPLSMTKGYAAPEVEQTYLQALALCQRALSAPSTSLGTGSAQEIGETSQLLPVLRGLSNYYHLRGEQQKAQELGEQMFDLAQRTEDPNHRMEAHQAVGETLFYMGELTTARAHFEQVIDLYGLKTYPYRYIQQDPGQRSRYFRALVLWILGYPDQALTSIHDTLSLTQKLSHPFHLAGTLLFSTCFYLFRREASVAQERAEELIALSREQNFDQRLAFGICMRACALVEQGWIDEGIVELRHGLDTLEDLSVRVQRAFYLTYLAKAYWMARQVEEGLTVLTEALAMVEKTGERWGESESYRLQGELLILKNVDAGRVEQQFFKAVDIARRQEAKSLELQATVSLCRFWQEQGKKETARSMLAEIYNWFTEGFDTLDLKEAKALLEELS
jgi:predicted ATPase/DNA-binding XRE family transcriptional regulator